MGLNVLSGARCSNGATGAGERLVTSDLHRAAALQQKCSIAGLILLA